MIFRAFVVGKDSWTKRVASTVQGSTSNKERERTAQHGVELRCHIIDRRAEASLLVPGITLPTQSKDSES